ncbi:MAG: hypothetical protein ACKOEV_02855 [Cytophagales bacterium]
MLEKMDFDNCLDGWSLPEQLIKQFISSVWCGANTFERILKLSLATNRREWFTDCRMSVNFLSTPLSFTF